MTNEILIPMLIGFGIGTIFGFMEGRSHPRKTLISIAYYKGRVDQIEGKGEDEEYALQ